MPLPDPVAFAEIETPPDCEGVPVAPPLAVTIKVGLPELETQTEVLALGHRVMEGVEEIEGVTDTLTVLVACVPEAPALAELSADSVVTAVLLGEKEVLTDSVGEAEMVSVTVGECVEEGVSVALTEAEPVGVRVAVPRIEGVIEREEDIVEEGEMEPEIEPLLLAAPLRDPEPVAALEREGDTELQADRVPEIVPVWLSVPVAHTE